MAYDDIQVHSSPMGGHCRVHHWPMEATFAGGKGDVVKVELDGQIVEAADEDIPEDILGVALGGPSGPGATTLNNPRTNTTYADGDLIPVAMPDASTYFVTKNFTTDGTTFDNAQPTAAVIGDICSLALISGVWGIDNGPGAGTQTCRIVDVLNARKESILTTGETLASGSTYWVVFAILASQMGPSAELIVPSA